jgi:hypothetical protein
MRARVSIALGRSWRVLLKPERSAGPDGDWTLTQGKVGQRMALENQIRALAVVFGVRLPRALTTAFIDQALKASEGVAGLSNPTFERCH